MARLTKGDITLAQVWAMSKKFYQLSKKQGGDNKRRRMKLDIVGGKITIVKNFEYDPHAGMWKGTSKRHVKFQFLIKSDPISYEAKDTVKIHKYPIFLVFYDYSLGIHSPFKFRSGGLKKPLFAPKGASKNKRLNIANANIRNGTDLWFFFHLEYILFMNRLLYGPNYATRKPVVTNPKGYIYFDKHTLFAVEKIMIPLLKNPTLSKKIWAKTAVNEEKP